MLLLPLLPLLHGVVAAQSETGECVKNMKGVHDMLARGDRTNGIARNQVDSKSNCWMGFDANCSAKSIMQTKTRKKQKPDGNSKLPLDIF